MQTRVPHLLLVSAFASGIAALMLELQWGRQLALAFGGSHNAVATVLVVFMLGLGVGSFLGGRVADRLSRPARGVAGIEAALVILGPVTGAALHRLPEFSADLLPGISSAENSLFVLSRFLVAALLLAVPTTLMGATYPMLVRAFASDVTALHLGIGRLYGVNTIGGVVGVVASGFWILPMAGIPGSVAAAATAHLIAAAAAGLASRTALDAAGLNAPKTRRDRPTTRRSTTLLALAAGSGALVLGAETLWHRALAMVLTNSTGSLTLLLALTLAGLGLGAVFGAPLLRRGEPMRWWRRLQLAIGAILVVQAVSLPGIAALVRLVRPDTGWPRVLVPPLAVGGLVILPAALVFGAAWPLLLAAATPRVSDGGRRVGRMGVLNSLGAAVGAALFGIVVFPRLGYGGTTLALAASAFALAAVAAARGKRRPVALAAAAVLAAMAVGLPGFGRVSLPSMTVASDSRTTLAYLETTAGTVVVTEEKGTGVRAMYVDNNAVIGESYDALKVARMLGLVPTLLHPDPQQVLVIGLGAGVTTATAAASDSVRFIDVAELIPGVVEAHEYFSRFNHGVVDDPRIRLHLNDGRNHLLLHPGPWDVITCDPIHPLYGSAPLYSADFFELARSRLAPGGVVCQYLPLHKMPPDAFRRAVATFQRVFPSSRVLFGLGHAMLFGSEEPVELDWGLWDDRLRRHALRNDLGASALHHPAQIAALLQLDADGCRTVAAGEPSTDLHPRLEFLAPAAFEPGVWRANARMLVEAYTSPIPQIANLPPGMDAQLQRLVAGKRLLLFSLLDRADGDIDGARTWLDRAIQVAGDDPEIVMYARQFAAEDRRR